MLADILTYTWWSVVVLLALILDHFSVSLTELTDLGGDDNEELA